MRTLLPVRHAMQQARNRRLPNWLRLAYWAAAHADENGHARAYPGDLRRLLAVDAHEVSRAIRLAKARGLLAESSHAGCLVLAGCATSACDAEHQELA
ncbi:hypothetical protein [Nocardioides bruguierae]|uniref:Uncharacterized protein n=1 Tax=Nocardioides bruguierae TaxID=2945102 RepID=A0A9X2D3X0_9ACTN|nr:hypothetical protein [Nocardioides bruguierae]MCM0618768.1 hypothetical protein [Nocardioides bruguierae]